MPTDLHPDVVAAINQTARSRLGRRFNRLARRKYGISGKTLAARQTAGEFGGRSTRTGRAVVSSAGARGPGQFIASTRRYMIQKYGVDPWKDDASAIKALELYDLERGGIEGYNPGMPDYAQYILRQRIDPNDRAALRGGSGGRFIPGSVTPGSPGSTQVTLGSKTIPGVSYAADREQAKSDLLLGGKLTMQKLLDYKRTVNSLQDIPARQVPGDIQVSRTPGTPTHYGPGSYAPGAPGGGQKVLPHTSHTLNEMFSIAQRVDKLNNRGQVVYQWGGGHGKQPAFVGQDVDCSGFISQILGVAPRVSGQFAASWGSPGRGKWVTVYANDEHVLVAMRDPRTRKVRWFGTSRSNPGGGAGEIAKPSPEYLSRFITRHPGR